MACFDIRGGSLERGRQTIVGLSTTAIFSTFAGDVFGTFRNKSNIMIYGHGVHHWLSTDPRIRDLE